MQSWAIGTTSEHLNTYTHKYMCIVMPVKVLEGSCTLEVSNETVSQGLRLFSRKLHEMIST